MLVAAKKIELTPIIINKPSVAVLVTMLSQAHMENNKTLNCYFFLKRKRIRNINIWVIPDNVSAKRVLSISLQIKYNSS